MRFCQRRAQPGPAARFFEIVCSMVLCCPPPPAFSGWHCDSGSQSDNGRHAELEFLNGRRRDRYASARPAGRVLGDRHVEFSVPLVFHVTQRPDVRVQHVDRGRTHSNSPAPEPDATPWENGRVTPSVSRDAVPASPTGPLLVLAPPVDDRQGCVEGLESGVSNGPPGCWRGSLRMARAAVLRPCA